MILLDTNALIWIDQRHPRVRHLVQSGQRLYISPANALELQLLSETGKVRLKAGPMAAVVDDPRWTLDDPPAWSWFGQALELSWTRDPFDRLLVAHARLRGWRLATSDGPLLEQLRADERFEI